MPLDLTTPAGAGKAIGASTLCLLLVLLVAPLLGPSRVDYARALRGLSPDADILWSARVPRVLLSVLAGGGLALAGVLFQALLRDALATPDTLGVSGGASLGAVLALVFGAGGPTIGLCACAGAALSLVLVTGLAAGGRRMSAYTLLLAGVTVNSMCFAVIVFLHNLASFSQSFAISRWLIGSIDAIDGRTLTTLASVVLPVSVALTLAARSWNLLALGEEWAATRGVATTRLLALGYLGGSAVAGAVTSITGPIGFVGLIVPHALRSVVGADHRILLPCSFLLGGAFLALCDTLARTAFAPNEIPVGVVTALLGGPFFVTLLRRTA